jgi:CheY-like chemotaxis protein
MWKVVISTQELTEREQQQCREAGVRYFWTKPATVDAREGQQGVRELLAEYRLWAAQQDVSPDL